MKFNVLDQIREGFRGTEKTLRPNFEMVAGLILAFERFDQEQREFLASLELHQIYTVNFWDEFFSSPQSVDSLSDVHITVIMLLEKGLALMDALQFSDERATFKDDAANAIGLVVPDHTGSEISVKDFAKFLNGVNGLYEVICSVNNIDGEDLTIVALDSGSPKLVVFGGNGKATKALGEVITEFWDRISFSGYAKRKADLKLYAQELELVEKIDKLEKSNSLSAEEAARMKCAAVTSLVSVGDVGALTIEHEQYLQEHPSLSSAPSRQLLAAPIESQKPKSQGEDDTGFENVVEEAVQGYEAEQDHDEHDKEEIIRELRARLRELENENKLDDNGGRSQKSRKKR